MKRCATCYQLWDDELVFCPVDAALLEAIEAPKSESAPEPTTEAAPAPSTPRRAVKSGPVDAAAVLRSALNAIESARLNEQDELRRRMSMLERMHVYTRAAEVFVGELTSQTDQVRAELDQGDSELRMWATFRLSLGEGRRRRTFPITAAYQRHPLHDVTLEIDLTEIGPDRDQRILRTEEIGGRAMSTRFGWQYTLRAPRELETEAEITAWLRTSFASIFERVYSNA